ncbi:MAG: glycosyltransferase family 9 protein [Nitrospiraceae bacterium]|nr:MAG: glycosyltransferase family 9 protein [Nitrospiraceae bacterium]
MKEILIINLTRMGDLIQTGPLMRGLKTACPDRRITLLANSPFAEICNGIPFIDELILFDMKGYRDCLRDGKHSLVRNYRFLEELMNRINSRHYDLAVNVTHSPVSALITSLVDAEEVRGFTVDSEGHRVIRHPWMRYFFNVIPNRAYNSFHLVDMYLKIGAVPPSRQGLIYHILPESEDRAAALLNGEGVQEHDLLIGIHLGASKSDKAWPVESYAELADMIAGRLRGKILLFGSPGESGLARRFETRMQVRVHNFVGRTGISELAALLRRCRILVSNDTGPLHIATAVGTQVVDISNANVHFMETGPYGEGHYVIQADLPCVPCGFDVQCPDMVCKSSITPQAVFEVVRCAVEGQELYALPEDPCWNSLQVYRSCFHDDGYLWFIPLVRRSPTLETLYRIVYRYVWNGEDLWTADEVCLISEGICRELSAYYRVGDTWELTGAIMWDLHGLAHLNNLAEEAFCLAGRIEDESTEDTMNVAVMKDAYKKIEEIDGKIELAGHTHPGIRTLTLIYRYTREAMEGNDLSSVVCQARSMYHDLMVWSGNMQELLKRIAPSPGAVSDGRPCELPAGTCAKEYMMSTPGADQSTAG